ncbi:MAG: membrane protein insertase YidC [Reyranellaceae bacterium]
MDTRNLILAIVASALIIFGWQFIFPAPEAPPPQQQQQSAQPGGSTAPGVPGGATTAPAPGAAPGTPAIAATRDRAAVLGDTQRVKIEAPEVTGSISLTGGRLDDVRLVRHRQTVDRNSPSVVLLSPPGAPQPYYAEHGWAAMPGIKVPGPDTVWTADAATLTPGQPVTLSWDNGAGLTFKQRYEIDDHFMFTVTQTVENASAQPVTLHPYGLVSRVGKPKTDGLFILHEGPFGVLNDSLKEFDYDDVKDKPEQKFNTTGGWIGITDKYWMATLVPDQSQEVQAVYRGSMSAGGPERFQVDYTAPAVTVAPGGSGQSVGRLYAGAKIVDTIQAYQEKFGISKFDLSIDWGWLFFLTKPMFHVLDWLYGIIGNFGLAIMALTVLVKLLFFPLANKSYQAMSKMKALTPEMQRLRERHGNDKQKLNQEMMALYKREKVNPAAGCLPILVQIPVFFALYKVLYVTIEMRHAPFFGWINDLSAPDPATVLTLFGFVPWDVPAILAFVNIGVWPLIMGITMFLQQKLNPTPADPVQAKIFLLMPIVFTFILAPFAAGLVIYWAWNNTLSIIQQYVIMRRMHVKVGGGVDPGAPSPLVGNKPQGAGRKKPKAKPKA